MTKQNVVTTPCCACDRDTRHDVLANHIESEYEYRVDTHYQIVECRGCGTKSFRKVIAWIEDVYQVEEDEWEVPKDVITYPSVLKGHKAVPDIDRVPSVVAEIYRQSLEAITVQSSILAGIGLRATIEAICNERKVTGRSLEQRIDKLAKAGLVSTIDADRLHAIRFLGNDAAHEIYVSDPNSLLIALRIIENLIVSLYILDGAASGALDTLIKNYTEFETLLSSKLSVATKGDELPLSRILGRDARRFHGYLKSHETQLISNITSGTYTKLSLGKLDSYAGSKEKFQHFVIL
ncbi:DUF4145 domain-containing protein [Aquitalea aquatilis]|uniref:DUF4145 domain-containing protein n=1 Tax=Aquitalea aquatilis TaxID=1537400 RepID=UPI0010BDFAB5|nr:DUF4145 domain-containing protein [Aquitalea aquatilis]